MKKPLFLLLPILMFAACIAERDYVVESDYSYKGKFRRYKTFDFMSTTDTVSFNGLSDGMIREEIMRRLESQGYRYIDKKPSMLIIYTVFGDNLKFHGFDQMELEYWDEKYSWTADYEESLAEIKEAEYNKVDYELKEGTLLIDFVDSKTHSVIWQGYASGLFDNANFFSKDIKYAVRSILNKYKLVAYNEKL